MTDFPKRPYLCGNLTLKESVESITPSLRKEGWFLRDGSDVTRTEVYFVNDRVAAFQDCLNGDWSPLYMDEQFYENCSDDAEFDCILKSASVFDTSKILTYSTGR